MATDLDDFIATTEHRRPSRILYRAGFTEDLRRRVVEHIGTENIAGHYGFYASAGVSLKRPEGLPPLDFSRYWHGVELPEGTRMSGGVARVPCDFFHFTHIVSPLRHATSLKEIEDYPFDDMHGWACSMTPEQVQQAHTDGRIVVGWVGHMYETAWQIRGLEQFLIDLVERPAWAECLLQRLADQNLIKATAYAQAGADLITTGDDVANQKALMFSPDMWRRIFHSRWAKIWRRVKEINPSTRIWYHSDGRIDAAVPDLIDAGLDILNPVQPECVDTDAIHKRFGHHLTFDGCIGTQSTMPWGTPDEVRARVKECIGKYGRNGGLMLAPTHVLEPEVPLANIDALFDACREFGTFE